MRHWMERSRVAWGSLLGLIVCLVLGTLFLVGSPETRSLWKALFFTACAAVFAFLVWRAWAPHPEPAEVTVTFTDTTITAKYTNGEMHRLEWANLAEVGVTTTDGGPFIEDVLWGLHAGGDVRVVYPNTAHGAQELLAAMQHRLPNFDSEALLSAMGSSDRKYFVVWRGVKATV
ncbi:MAG: hypothetical protein C4K60_06860 [Ideonella sp. MAG2]|nr:MAG: hypothetical protein C4K60_06860 [Ideonella sp. MAG2]